MGVTRVGLHWDIFCKVVDNYGDIGVCWRLCRDLAARGEQVRLWTDDPSALTWMAPGATLTDPGVQILPWLQDAEWPEPGDAVVEAFGCELPLGCVRRMAAKPRPPAWINLEYLSAEPFAARCHGLPSPVMHGPGQGLVKHFFYPGFTPGTGGLLREPRLSAQQAAFEASFERSSWLKQLGLPAPTDATDATDSSDKWVSLFCYEPLALSALMQQLASRTKERTHLLVTTGRATRAVQTILNNKALIAAPTLPDQLSISYLPPLSQPDFDQLLWACDLNFVRGEDSLVRALWAGKPLVWQIYPQDDNAHQAKLDAFLTVMAASPALRHWHHSWNGMNTAPLPALDALWGDRSMAAARQRLWRQDDLATQLVRFVKNR